MLRSRLLTLVLTIFVGLGLASQALAHRMPTAAEQAMQALVLAGVPVAAICGQVPGKSGCPEASCPVCPGGAALTGGGFAAPLRVLVLVAEGLTLPVGTQAPVVRLLLGHDAQGPPAA